MIDPVPAAPPRPLFFPTACPECDRIIAPVTKPRPGDRAVCPYCMTRIVFIARGVFVRIGSPAAPS